MVVLTCLCFVSNASGSEPPHNNTNNNSCLLSKQLLVKAVKKSSPSRENMTASLFSLCLSHTGSHTQTISHKQFELMLENSLAKFKEAANAAIVAHDLEHHHDEHAHHDTDNHKHQDDHGAHDHDHDHKDEQTFDLTNSFNLSCVELKLVSYPDMTRSFSELNLAKFRGLIDILTEDMGECVVKQSLAVLNTSAGDWTFKKESNNQIFKFTHFKSFE
jgi:G3E family GTPase